MNNQPFVVKFTLPTTTIELTNEMNIYEIIFPRLRNSDFPDQDTENLCRPIQIV